MHFLPRTEHLYSWTADHLVCWLAGRPFIYSSPKLKKIYAYIYIYSSCHISYGARFSLIPFYVRPIGRSCGLLVSRFTDPLVHGLLGSHQKRSKILPASVASRNRSLVVYLHPLLNFCSNLPPTTIRTAI